MKEERLYLVGYMASGKTTLGRALAEAIGWHFLDLDAEIERREGKPIAAIMEIEGEEGFRRKESEALRHTASLRQTVIACGGGTPCWRDNMEFITLHGHSLWLLASPARLAERILAAGPTRPLVAGLEGDALTAHITSHLLRRQPFYCRAEWRLSGEHLESPAEIAAAVDDFLARFKSQLHINQK